MRTHIIVSDMSCEVRPVSHAGMLHHERQNSPIAEVIAPDGYEFSGGETSLMAHSAADLNLIEDDEHLTETEASKQQRADDRAEEVAEYRATGGDL